MAVAKKSRSSTKPKSETNVQASRLPKALAKRAEASAAAKRRRLAQEALVDIAFIKRKRAQINEAFYDIGETLVRLKVPEVVGALGYKTFVELCDKELEISANHANHLIHLVERMTRDEALELGQSKAIALLNLANATPALDTPAKLGEGKIKLPSGKVIDLSKASSHEIDEAAREIRAGTKKKSDRRGKTVTDDERATASALEKKLRALGAERVVVCAVATRPGRPADLRIEHLAVAELVLLKKALMAKG